MNSAWEEVTLGAAGLWLSGGTPSKQAPALWDGPLPWVSPKDMKRSRLADAIDHVAQSAVGNGTQLAPLGSLLMVVRGMILAHTFPVALTTASVAFNQDIKALLPGKEWSAEFLLHWLQFKAPDVLRLVDVANHGTKRLPSERLFALPLMRPPIAEQRKIATILSSVDDAIASTQAVIDQLQVVKKAMMAELLARGLPGRHARFKQTEIGEMPEGWELRNLGAALATIDAGWSPQCESGPAGAHEWGVLKVSAVSWGEFQPEENKRLPDHLEPRLNAEVRTGDLLVSRANTPDLVGRCVLVRETRSRLMLSDKLLRLRVNESVASAGFVRLILESAPARRQIEDGATGSSRSMKNISQEKLRALVIPCPPLEEQADISRCFELLRGRERTEAAGVTALIDLKSALMSVLLTGELRVTPDEVAA